MGRGKRDAMRAALGLVARMMRRQRLTVGEAAAGYPFEKPAVRRHLRAIEAEISEVRCVQTNPETWAFVWPSEQQTEPSVVWALAAARSLLGAFHETGVGFHLTNLLDQHRARLRDAPAASVADLARMFVTVARSADAYGYDRSVVDSVMRAVMDSAEFSAEYCHFEGDPDKVVIEPYSLVVADEGLYLIGRCVESANGDHIDRKRMYNLRRLQDVRRTTRTFNYPVLSEHDPVGDLYHCFSEFLPRDSAAKPENIVLRFSPGWVGYLRRHRIHRTQEPVVVQHDGKVQVTVRVYLNYDLVRWVRGHGDEVEVVAPSRLAEWVKGGGGAKWMSS